jgi:hypothetical protein
MKFTRDTLETLRHTGRSASPHGYATRAFHWLGGALLAYAFIENGERTRVLFNSAAMHRDVILGAIIALVFLARPIWVYFFRGGSRLPTDAPRWEKAATWISQISIYGSLAAVLASGFLIASLAPESHIFRARRRIRTDNPLLAVALDFPPGWSVGIDDRPFARRRQGWPPSALPSLSRSARPPLLRYDFRPSLKPASNAPTPARNRHPQTVRFP